MAEHDPIEPTLTYDGQYRLLVEAVTDYAIYMLDPAGLVQSWNPGAQRFKGYTAAEVLGRHFSMFYSAEDRANGAPERALATARREDRCESEGWRIRKDGSRFWAHVIVDTIRGPDGEIRGFAKITRDITQQKEAQRAVDEAKAALFQSQKLDAIGQLTGGIAHDFNNVLMAILGSLEVVRKRVPEDPKITRFLDNAIRGAQRGASLTKRMLAFARQHEHNPELIDLRALLEGTIDLLQSSLGASTTIELHLPATACPVHGDRHQIELALLNLALNSRDAMPEGGVLAVSLREELVVAGQKLQLNPGRYACVSVVDTGEGMDDATLSRAVEPFFTTKGQGKGTGLGLSLVHGIVTQSGGSLDLKSARGEGTTAEIWLPLARAAGDAPVAEPAIAAPPAKMRPLTILAVDDDNLVLINTAAMLEDLGHVVLEASSGAQAIEILRRGAAVDLLITDLTMPQMTGAQLIEAAAVIRPDLPAVIVSGYADVLPATAPSVLQLAKPYRQDDLARIIADAIRRGPAPRRVLTFPSRG